MDGVKVKELVLAVTCFMELVSRQEGKEKYYD